MHKPLYQKTIAIGTILATPKADRAPLLQGYIADHYPEAYALATALNSQKSWRNSQASLVGVLEAWLLENDAAYRNATQSAAAYRTLNNPTWEELGDALSLSPQTVRQIIQALQRGGWN